MRALRADHFIPGAGAAPWRCPRFLLACACLVATLCGLATDALAKPAPHERSSHAKPAAPPTPPPIRIGEINSYKAAPELLDPYRRGWQMAVEEINAQGGVLGRRLQVIERDDGGTPEGALAAAQQLAERDQVDLLFGGLRSEVGLALAGYAEQKQAFYLATLPMTSRLVWEQGNAYTYHLAPSTWMQVTALVPKAFGLRKRRWALVYPDDAYGQPTAAVFRSIITSFQSRTAVVAEDAVPARATDARERVRRLLQAKPDAIFNALHGAELARFVHEARAQGLFQTVSVVAPLAGQPEALHAMGNDAEAGWLVSGYPCEAADADAGRRFADDYLARWGVAPGANSALGYIAVKAIAEGLSKAGAVAPHALADAFAGLDLDTPYGRIQFRALDHQSTLGVCLGTTAEEDGRVVVHPLSYLDGARLQPPDKVVHRLTVPGKQQ